MEENYTPIYSVAAQVIQYLFELFADHRKHVELYSTPLLCDYTTPRLLQLMVNHPSR